MSLTIHESIMEKLNYFYKIHKIPNIIFHGQSGSGKRSIVHNFINVIYNGDKEKIKTFVMHVNCAHGKGIKFIRDELKFFAKTHINSNGGDVFKSIVLSNADKLTIDAQSALRRCIELFSHTTRFFIIVEDKYKLLKPILSRFCEIYVPEPVVNGQSINLYRHNLSETFKLKDVKQLRIEWLKKNLLKTMGPLVGETDSCVNVVVTDEFKHAVEKSGLTGVTFKPIIKKRIVLLEWEKWNKNLIQDLKKKQKSDGHFEGNFGPAVATSMNLLALALNFRFLPIYER